MAEKLPITLQDIASNVFNPIDAYIADNEGYRSEPYKDTKNKKTIGYGFNMDDPTVASILPKSVRDGNRAMLEGEAKFVLKSLRERAEGDAMKFVGADTYNSLTPSQKTALTDMAYNLGYTRLRGFENMREALIRGDKQAASRELLDSKYARTDVPNRAKKNALLMLQ